MHGAMPLAIRALRNHPASKPRSQGIRLADGEVEHRAVADPVFMLKEEADPLLSFCFSGFLASTV